MVVFIILVVIAVIVYLVVQNNKKEDQARKPASSMTQNQRLMETVKNVQIKMDEFKTADAISEIWTLLKRSNKYNRNNKISSKSRINS